MGHLKNIMEKNQNIYIDGKDALFAQVKFMITILK